MKACGGFVYVVSVVGITGARDRLPVGLRELLARLRTMTDLPLCVGFGVSKPEHVRELKEIADGVIVGSALVKKLEAAAKDRTAAMAGVRQLVKELERLRCAIRGAASSHPSGSVSRPRPSASDSS